MKLDYKSLFKRLGIIFSCLIVVYYLLLVLAYCIPYEWISQNWHESVNLIASEPTRWEVLKGYTGTKLDTFTDDYMFQRLANGMGQNPFQAAMWNGGYPRYWFGIIAFLRPLLVFVAYGGIRYMNIFFILGVLCFTFAAMKKTLGTVYSIGFLITLGMIHVWIFPLSLQYTPVFAIMMVSIQVILKMWEKGKLNLSNTVILFFVTGSITNYFDLLTAPLLTFGIPFIVYFILMNKDSIQQVLHNYLIAIYMGISWLTGYAITWAAKWVFGSIILKYNLIQQALDQMVVRTVGKEEEVMSIPQILERLFDAMFPAFTLNIFLVLIIIWAVMFILRHKPFQQVLSLTPLLLLALLPIAWYIILQNHNNIHYYFTYRILAISVFSIFTFMVLSVNWTKKKRMKN